MNALSALGRLLRVSIVPETINSKVITIVMFKPIEMQEVSVNKLLLTMLISVSLMSCSQCVDCELNGNIERLCDTEFDNPDQYQNAIDDREAAGATCSPVSL